MNMKALLCAAGVLVLAACSRSAPEVAGYALQPVVDGGSRFHGVHGLRFDANGTLYAVSVIGQSIFTVDTQTGAVETFIGPPEGQADDLAFGPDGTIVWTAIEDGILYARSPGGPIRRLMENQRGVNAVSFSRDGQRLFATLVFYGDALYEVDITGQAPPRLVVDRPGGLNAFQLGDDGMIYGPLVFGKRLVRINPDTGEMTTLSDEFEDPGALKLDFRGAAYVLNNDTELRKVDLATGRSTLVTTLPAGADNLALDSQGRIFVSLSEVNAIVEVNPDDGAIRYVVSPAPLTSATGLAVLTENGEDTLFLGDLFGGVKRIEAATGAIHETPFDIFQPAHVSVTDANVLAVGQVFGVVQLRDRRSFQVLGTWTGFDSPGDALEAPDGTVIVAETGSGRLLRITGPEAADREAVAGGLAAPTGMAWAGEGAVYVTETGGGRVTRIDLATGAAQAVAENLAQPEGIAVDADGSLLVVEVGAKQLSRIDPASGVRTTVAGDLPIGLANGPSLFRSVAVSDSAIYLNSDVDNSVYRLVPAGQP